MKVCDTNVYSTVAVTDDSFIKSRILIVRDVQVILDRDLATLYCV